MKGTKLALRCALACFIGVTTLASAATSEVGAGTNTGAAAFEDASKHYRAVGAQHLYSTY